MQSAQSSRDFTMVAIVAVIMLGCSFFTAVVVQAQGDAEGRTAAKQRFERFSAAS